MNYALTINGTIISGVHEGRLPFHGKTFEKNPWLSGHEVRPIPSPAEYKVDMDIRCYEPDGTPKDPAWCIESGFMKLPPNTEIIDGELVDITKPEADASESIKSIITGLRGELELLKSQVTEQSIKIGGIETIIGPVTKEVPKTIA